MGRLVREDQAGTCHWPAHTGIPNDPHPSPVPTRRDTVRPWTQWVAEMIEPIKTGDRCEVVAGAMGTQGPNIGKIVTVVSLRGEHGVFGRIWSCRAENLITEYGAVGDRCDFAQSWLRKIPPSIPHAANDETDERERA